jgi:hypothetical protein
LIPVSFSSARLNNSTASLKRGGVLLLRPSNRSLRKSARLSLAVVQTAVSRLSRIRLPFGLNLA